MRRSVPMWLVIMVIVVAVFLVVGVFFVQGRKRTIITEQAEKEFMGGQYPMPTPVRQEQSSQGVGPMYQAPP